MAVTWFGVEKTKTIHMFGVFQRARPSRPTIGRQGATPAQYTDIIKKSKRFRMSLDKIA